MEINEQDWELVNDDGFIYRRLKRTHPDSTPTAAVPLPPPDLAAEAKSRRDRKKTTLLNLKTKYEQEIHLWELLSNTLHALQHRTQNPPPPPPPPPAPLPVLSDQTVSVTSSQELAGSLLAQVEALEASISEISRLCDVVEALCDAEEQRLRQPFIELPIWEQSPRELITLLLEE